MRAFGGDVCNKALIVSDRCEIGIVSVPRTPVSAPALGAANTPQPSRNPTAASQRLNNLRLKTHTQHKSDEDVPAKRQLLGQMPADRLCSSDLASLAYWKHLLFFFFYKDERLGGAASSDTFPFALSCPDSPPLLAFWRQLGL